MSQNSNISYLNFLKKVGISSFLQNKPNIFYENEDDKNNNLSNLDINEIKKLNDLESLIIKSNNLKYKNYSNKITIGDGNENAKIFIIGESPEEENKKMKPFAGETEKLLDKMLKAINLDKKFVYKSNVVPWLIDKNKKIENIDILKCLPFIQRQIEIINPKIILLMGPIAANAILNSNLDFTNLRSKWHKYKSINLDQTIECLVTYHPKYLIQFPKEKKYAWEDLQMLQKKINEN